jgi:hypothetical protein
MLFLRIQPQLMTAGGIDRLRFPTCSFLQYQIFLEVKKFWIKIACRIEVFIV